MYKIPSGKIIKIPKWSGASKTAQMELLTEAQFCATDAARTFLTIRVLQA